MVILHFFVYSLFCASGIILCMPGCLAVATSLAPLEKQAHANFCATVLSQRPNNHTPSPRYAAIHVLHVYIQNRKPVAVRMTNTGTSMVDSMKKIFIGPATSYHAVRVFLRMCKMLSTLNFDFSRKYNCGIETIIKFIFHVEKTRKSH